jgi:hypothetical protein
MKCNLKQDTYSVFSLFSLKIAHVLRSVFITRKQANCEIYILLTMLENLTLLLHVRINQSIYFDNTITGK